MESCFDLECYVWLKDKLLKIDHRTFVHELNAPLRNCFCKLNGSLSQECL